MDIHIKQNTLRVITSISLLVVFVSSLSIAFVPLNVIDNLLQVFLLEPVYTLLLFSAVYDEANGVFENYIMLAIVIILMAAVLTACVLLFLKKKAGCYIALIILALDMINRVPLLFYAFNNDRNSGIGLLIGLLFKIILMIVVACYMRVLKET